MTDLEGVTPITKEERERTVKRVKWLSGIMVDSDKGELYSALMNILAYEARLRTLEAEVTKVRTEATDAFLKTVSMDLVGQVNALTVIALELQSTLDGIEEHRPGVKRVADDAKERLDAFLSSHAPQDRE